MLWETFYQRIGTLVSYFAPYSDGTRNWYENRVRKLGSSQVERPQSSRAVVSFGLNVKA
jgi:hypothetical protein